MKRNLKRALIAPAVAIAVGAATLLSGCGAKSLERAYVDSYGNLIYCYTDGSTENLGNVRGSSQSDATSNNTSVGIKEMYEEYVARYGDIEYADFLKIYLDTDGENSSETSATAINKCLLSSATVYTFFTETYTYNQGFIQGYKKSETQVYSGSAVIYEMDDYYTYFVTNYHVIYDPDSDTKIPEDIKVYLYGSESVPVETSVNSNGTSNFKFDEYAINCEYIGGAISADIAVIRAKTADVKAINPGVKPVTLGERYFVGETAIAVGNTEGEGISVTKGIISVDNETIALDIDGTTRYYRAMRIDTAIYSGNSGGGLFNNAGELIGITNAGDGEDQNINYAVPLNIVTGVADNILYYFKNGSGVPVSAMRPQIGITVSETEVHYAYDFDSDCGKSVAIINISSVSSGSIAKKIGLKSGDVLLSMIINGEEISFDRIYDLDDVLYTLREGDSIKFTYKRDSKEGSTSEYKISSSDLKEVE